MAPQPPSPTPTPETDVVLASHPSIDERNLPGDYQRICTTERCLLICSRRTPTQYNWVATVASHCAIILFCEVLSHLKVHDNNSEGSIFLLSLCVAFVLPSLIKVCSFLGHFLAIMSLDAFANRKKIFDYLVRVRFGAFHSSFFHNEIHSAGFWVGF